MTKWRVTACATALSLLASGAVAASLNVTTQGNWAFNDENNQNAWYVSTSFAVGQPPDDVDTRTNVGAGVFRLTGTDVDTNEAIDFLAFCLQPLEYLTLPKVHEMGHNLTMDIYEDLMALANNAWTSVDGSTNAAAFQMAVWEIANETGGYDIDDGHFRITGSGASDAAEVVAQGWLDNIANDTWTAGDANFMILSAEGTQDLLTNVPLFDDSEVNEVPLPASGLLLLAGLAGAGAVARRQKG